MRNGYQIHNIESTNPASQAALEKVRDHYQFVPNALAAMAESPETVLAYLALDELVHHNSLTEEQRHVVFLAITREYDCNYCVAAHTAFAQMASLDGETVQKLREGSPLADPKLEALRQFAVALVHSGCDVNEEAIQAFIASGFTRRHVLDIITMMANKLIAVYANRIMGTDLDEMLKPAEWNRVA